MFAFLKLFFAQRTRRFRPHIEALEERFAPANDIWTDATGNGQFMTANNWSLFRVPTFVVGGNQDVAVFQAPQPGVPNSGSTDNCTLTNANVTILGLSLQASYDAPGGGLFTLNGASLTMVGPATDQSIIANPKGIAFTTTGDELVFQNGTESMSSAGGFRGAQGAVVIDLGSQFTIKNTAQSQSTADFFVGDTSPGTGSLVIKNKALFSLKGGAYIYISAGGILSLQPATLPLKVLDGGATGSYIDNYGQVLEINAGNQVCTVDVPLINHNGATLLVNNSNLEFGTANATSNNVSIWQRGGLTNLAVRATLTADEGFLQSSGNPGGTLQTDDSSTCTLRTLAGALVEIDGGFVKIDVNGGVGTYGSLTIQAPLVFNGGEYDAKIAGATSGLNDEITATSIDIKPGISKLVVTVNGVKGVGQWNEVHPWRWTSMLVNTGPPRESFPCLVRDVLSLRNSRPRPFSIF